MSTSTSPTAAIVTSGDLAVNATSFARHIPAANLSTATQRTYLASIARLADLLEAESMPTDVANVRREHVEAFMEDQLATWKPATADRARSLATPRVCGPTHPVPICTGHNARRGTGSWSRVPERTT